MNLNKFLSISILFLLVSISFYKFLSISSKNGQISGISTKSSSVSVDVFIGEYEFTLFGYTSAKALVTIEGQGIYDQTSADNKGYFEFHNRFSPLSPREACVTAKDQLGRITSPTCIPPFPTKYDVTIGPVILPPTLSLDKENYWVDDEVKLSGQTIPHSQINLSMFTKENTILTTLKTIGAKVVKPVEAFSLSPLETTADNEGNFSISLPSSRPEFFRLFAQTSYDKEQSPESVKLNIKILPVWMIIIQLFLLLWSLIKSRLMEIIIIGELIAVTIFFIRRYLHPHIIASSRSLVLRKGFPLINSRLTRI